MPLIQSGSSRLLRSIRVPRTVQPINARAITISSISTYRSAIDHVSRSGQATISYSFSPSSSSRVRRFTSTSKSQNEQGENSASMTTTISPEEYEKVSERDMDILHENLEIYVEEFGSNDWEVEYSSGVMNLTLPPYGTYVINKQPPNLQIWISSPISGPARFDYSPTLKGWVHHRNDSIKLKELLESELRGLLEKNGGGVDSGEWEGTGL